MTEGPGRAVGFVGLGNMGIPMTTRLVAAGYQVRGFDTSAAAMANFAAIGPQKPAVRPYLPPRSTLSVRVRSRSS